MSDLTDFLLARIAEDEAVARGVDSRLAWLEIDAENLSEFYDSARVLAECEAKRRVVREVEKTLESATFVPGGSGRLIVESGVRAILRHLAAIYSAHPDYRDEWGYLP